MMKRKLIFELSADIFDSLSASGYNEERLSSEAKRFLAAGLFSKKILTLGKASEVSGLNTGRFIEFLSENGMPFLDYEEDEIKAEKETTDKLVDLLKERST